MLNDSRPARPHSGWISYAFNVRYSVFARYDDVKLSRDVSPQLKDKYFKVGVAYKPIKNIDVGLVYKDERVNNGSATVSGADANGTGGSCDSVSYHPYFSRRHGNSARKRASRRNRPAQMNTPRYTPNRICVKIGLARRTWVATAPPR
jgi:hypothetical protein